MTHADAPAPPPRSTLVVTAHAGDFVWRAGGAIALASSRGEKVTIACLTFGERGESARAWREGRTLEEIKAIRREEAERAAAILGAEVRFFDAGDYPLVASAELTDRLVAVHRETQPDVVLTHPVEDPYNGDHPAANRMALEARVLAQAIGYPGPGEIIGAPPVFYFEPHQPEMSGFRPEVLLDTVQSSVCTTSYDSFVKVSQRAAIRPVSSRICSVGRAPSTFCWNSALASTSAARKLTWSRRRTPTPRPGLACGWFFSAGFSSSGASSCSLSQYRAS
ncbi:PIG-L deacetylase family protein [Streptomyces sp. 1222.5]|uniref:PIG-L deacetylase family protein n=1 Tax=Streptomyces sp. 1222.5 TaxID=1881026 RepID=UPI003D726BEB